MGAGLRTIGLGYGEMGALEQRGVVFVPLVWRKFVSALGPRALV